VAKGKADKHDPQFEIVFYENILRHSPDFVEALSALAELYTRAGRHVEGLSLDRRLEQLRPEDPVILYNLACSCSLTGDVAGAFDILRRALDSGYQDLAYLEQDPDLLNLLKDPGFQEYYRGQKDKKGAARDL